VQNPVLVSALDRPAFDRTQLCLFSMFFGLYFYQCHFVVVLFAFVVLRLDFSVTLPGKNVSKMTYFVSNGH